MEGLKRDGIALTSRGKGSEAFGRGTRERWHLVGGKGTMVETCSQRCVVGGDAVCSIFPLGCCVVIFLYFDASDGTMDDE